MIYKDIKSSVFLQFDTSYRFPINRGVRQGCGISPFLFLLVVELLSLNIRHNPNIKGLRIFDSEIRISQLADDTTLLLENTNQVAKALEIINTFSEASGLKLNIPKCEILCLFDSIETSVNGIPIKDNVKYLGIHVSKIMSIRQERKFLPKVKKAKLIFNNWLQRDLSFLGRVLLIKADVNCVNSPDSIWYFIPHNMYRNLGGLKFLLTCNFSPSKLPIKLSKFHE
ncbi:hypothetical protein H4Q32_007217 [Labeo rohita]|uniref:Reverse transcriptase domain-containing protein n=1 Tax=Labeo rohita TaxID=84645 RepID=A0ABQ8MFC5_LABRO|nr:hypothetical protein H4Q32_007217 [Labeo rohita]